MTPGELAAFEVLDGARRAGWARVAALEEIIDVYRSTVLALCDVIVDLDGTVATPADYLRIDALLAALDHADPYNRHRWPAR